MKRPANLTVTALAVEKPAPGPLAELGKALLELQRFVLGSDPRPSSEGAHLEWGKHRVKGGR